MSKQFKPKVSQREIIDMLLSSVSQVEIVRVLGYKSEHAGKIMLNRLMKRMGFSDRLEMMAKEIVRLRGEQK